MAYTARSPWRQMAAIGRGSMIVGLVLGFCLFLALLWFTFSRYVGLATLAGAGPKPSLPQLVGKQNASIAYLLLGAFIACCYIGVGISGTRKSHPEAAHPASWRIGAPLGLLLGLMVFLLGFAANLTPWAILPQNAGWVICIGALIGAGIWGTQQTGRISTAAMTAFWCGLVLALMTALSLLIQDNLFANMLIHSASWQHDHICRPYQGQTLAACEIGDDLGFILTVLVSLPLISAGLGALGGLLNNGLGKSSSQANATTTATASQEKRAYVPLLLFSGMMLTIFLVEIFTTLW